MIFPRYMTPMRSEIWRTTGVRNKQRQTELLHLLQQVYDLGLYRCVKRGRRLVANKKLRAHRKQLLRCLCALLARKLVRVKIGGFGLEATAQIFFGYAPSFGAEPSVYLLDKATLCGSIDPPGS